VPVALALYPAITTIRHVSKRTEPVIARPDKAVYRFLESCQAEYAPDGFVMQEIAR
jgi:hypothetical protein